MKFQASELPIGKPQSRRKTSRLAPLIALVIVITLPLYYPTLRDSWKQLYETASPPYVDSITQAEPPPTENPCSTECHPDNTTALDHRLAPIRKNNDKDKSRYRGELRSRVSDEDQCDLFSGEWTPDADGPYYTNDTCNSIQEHQNCLKFGRPDRGFLKWRWKPDDCELPLFEPQQFLKLVREKSLAFVGDSVAQESYAVFDPSLVQGCESVKTEKTDPNDERRPFNLYLDEPDLHWTSQIALFDYVVISAGHWFFRPTYFHLRGRLAGCLYCSEPNVTHLTSYFSYRHAFRTAFRAVNEAGFRGVAFLRTYAPSHFDGAAWDKGGDCVRTHPYRRSEVVLEDYSLQLYLIQLEELRVAQEEGRRSGGTFKLFDATVAMLLRPDGHPSKYGHWPVENQTFANDCVHWCLPGPIDAWNDFLHQLLKRETDGVDYSVAHTLFYFL
ncbi:hypothetical protein AAHA92_09337 [Salvia divinorum]|uniref:Trichome birefringence-like N-terminal domain-containing protein n=1 Tax=Salvia divinorum TaxID=28513 RepID=A0ABD1HRV0_SALDI